MHNSAESVLSRSEFLRLGALAAGGLGAQALLAPSSAIAADNGEGYVVAITHGPQDPTRVMLALTTASLLPRGDNHVWFAIDGGEVCKKEIAAKISSPMFPKQGTAQQMIETIRARGTAIHI